MDDSFPYFINPYVLSYDEKVILSSILSEHVQTLTSTSALIKVCEMYSINFPQLAKLNPFKIALQCVLIFNISSLHTSPKYKTVNTFRRSYKSRFSRSHDLSEEEWNSLFRFANWTSLISSTTSTSLSSPIMGLRRNKLWFMKVVPLLSEGWNSNYPLSGRS